ncbi:hypothetical protein GE09DRAFT_1113010 [Coniochaeta sp. 2T2.1]|nr:hypothetical protein GE09DRAFT_1113010 [Coniochaeta sp. 2T2.1]
MGLRFERTAICMMAKPSIDKHTGLLDVLNPGHVAFCPSPPRGNFEGDPGRRGRDCKFGSMGGTSWRPGLYVTGDLKQEKEPGIPKPLFIPIQRGMASQYSSILVTLLSEAQCDAGDAFDNIPLPIIVLCEGRQKRGLSGSHSIVPVPVPVRYTIPAIPPCPSTSPSITRYEPASMQKNHTGSDVPLRIPDVKPRGLYQLHARR